MWTYLRSLFGAAPPSPALPALPPLPRYVGEAEGFRFDAAGFRRDSFVNALSGLGGSGDKGAAATPLLTRPLLVEAQLDALCQNCGIARRITSLHPDNATRSGWYVQDPSADADPLADEDDRLDIESRVHEAATMAQRYGTAFTFLRVREIPPPGFRGDWWDLQSLPLDPRRVIEVENLVNFDTLQCVQRTWDGDDTSPNFTLPETYTVSANVAGATILGMPVHWTRLIRWTGIPLTPRLRLMNRGLDLSILQPAYDAIRNDVGVTQAGATYIQDLSVPVFKSPLLRANSAGDKSALYQAMMTLLAQGRSLLNMTMLEPEDSLERVSASVSGFADLDDAQRARVCANVGIPQVVLYQGEPGGLSTDDKSGRVNWYADVASYQRARLRPGLRRLYNVLYHQLNGPTKGRAPKSWSVEFNPIEPLSDVTMMDLMGKAATMDKTYVDMGVYTPRHVALSRFSRRGWRLQILPVPEPAEAPAADTPAAAGAPTTDTAAHTDAIPLRVEVPAGETRSGVSPDGAPWVVKMPCDYGEIPGTKGLDGEPVDYLLIPGGPRGMAFIVEQLLPPDAEGAPDRADAEMEGEGDEPAEGAPPAQAEGGDLDEHKVILGAQSEPEARALLQQVYGAAGRWGRVAAVPEAQLLPWLAARAERRSYLLYDAIDFSPPKAVIEELRRGLAWHDEGKSGRGLVPATVAWARRLARGAKISPKKVKAMRAWLARHATDKKGEGYKPGEPGFPSPGRVAWALWGGDDAVPWSNKVVEQMERAARA